MVFQCLRYWFATRSDLAPRVRELDSASTFRRLRGDVSALRRCDWGPESLAEGNSGDGTRTCHQFQWIGFVGKKYRKILFSMGTSSWFPVKILPWVKPLKVDSNALWKLCVIFFERSLLMTFGWSLDLWILCRSSQLPVLWLAQSPWDFLSISQLFARRLRVNRPACSIWDPSRCSVHTTSMPSI